MSWRAFLALVIVAAAVAGAAGAAMTLLVGKSDGVTTGVRLGPPASLPNIDREPFCVPLHHFCIAEAEPGQVVALYTYDPHAVFRERGCEVRWRPDIAYPSNSPNPGRGVFLDPCGGSSYDISGHRLFGPAPRDLDRFPVQVTKDATVVDTRTLICGDPQLADATYGCQLAPVGD